MMQRKARKISVIIPVYREADRINDLIDHLREFKYDGECEIIVVDGSEAAETIAAIRDPAVRCIASPKGRARQMNAGASRARGDVLLFLHADTLLPEHAFERVDAVVDDPRYAGGAFSVQFDSPRWQARLFGHVVSLRSRLACAPLGDQGIFLRREYFDRIGGFPDVPIMEDVALVRRIKRDGHKIRVLREPVRTSARRMEREGYWYCALRNIVLLALYRVGTPPRRLKAHYPDNEPAKARPERRGTDPRPWGGSDLAANGERR